MNFIFVPSLSNHVLINGYKTEGRSEMSSERFQPFEYNCIIPSTVPVDVAVSLHHLHDT